MIILDTNVLSEPLRPAGDPAVTVWLDAQNRDALFTTTITAGELWLGLELLPIGRRRSGLKARIEAVLAEIGESRTLPYTIAAARFYAVLVARARANGHAIAVADAQIAAIAAAHGFAVATRDTLPFTAAGMAVVNPWLTPA